MSDSGKRPAVFVNWDIFVKSALGDKIAASELVDIAAGKYEAVSTTDYVMNKAVDRLLTRGEREKAAQLVGLVFGPLERAAQAGTTLLSDKIEPLVVKPENIEDARRWFLVHAQTPLDLVDWTTLSIMSRHRIDRIATFDKTFDTLGQLGDRTVPLVSRTPGEKHGSRIRYPLLLFFGAAALAAIPVLGYLTNYMKITSLSSDVYLPLAIAGALLIIASIIGERVVEAIPWLKKP